MQINANWPIHKVHITWHEKHWSEFFFWQINGKYGLRETCFLWKQMKYRKKPQKPDHTITCTVHTTQVSLSRCFHSVACIEVRGLGFRPRLRGHCRPEALLGRWWETTVISHCASVRVQNGNHSYVWYGTTTCSWYRALHFKLSWSRNCQSCRRCHVFCA